MAGSQAQSAQVAARYASALFDLARAAKSLDAVSAGLTGFADLMAKDAGLSRAMTSPTIDAAAKARAATAVAAKSGFHDLAVRLIGVMATNRRAGAIPAAAAAFAALVAAEKGLVSADVVSAQPLRADQRAALADALKASMGRDVDMTLTVDPALLGGLRVKIGSRLLDTSLATKLEGLKTVMKGA